jgi:hypothetical protein
MIRDRKCKHEYSRKFDRNFLIRDEENSTAELIEECLSRIRQGQSVAIGVHSEDKGIQTLKWYLTKHISVSGFKMELTLLAKNRTGARVFFISSCESN